LLPNIPPKVPPNGDGDGDGSGAAGGTGAGIALVGAAFFGATRFLAADLFFIVFLAFFIPFFLRAGARLAFDFFAFAFFRFFAMIDPPDRFNCTSSQ